MANSSIQPPKSESSTEPSNKPSVGIFSGFGEWVDRVFDWIPKSPNLFPSKNKEKNSNQTKDKKIDQNKDKTLARFSGKPMKFLLFEIAPEHWWLYALIVLIQLVNALISVAPSFLLGTLAQWLQKGTGTLNDILSLGAMIVMFFMISDAFGSLVGYLNNMRKARTSRLARMRLFEYTLGQSYNFFTKTLSGKLAGRLNQIGDSINETGWCSILIFGEGFLKLFIAGTLLATIDWHLTVVFSIWMIGYYLHVTRKMMSLRGYHKEVSNNRSNTNGQAVDSITNFPIIFSNGGGLSEIERLDDYSKIEAEAVMQAAHGEYRALNTRTNWFGFLGIALLITVWALSTVGHFPIGNVTMVFVLWMYCTGLGWINWVIGGLLWNHAQAQEQLESILEPYTVLEAKEPHDIPFTTPTIDVKSLYFSYQEGTPIFKNLNLTINPREKVGIVGRSGSGKSTFISLLLRYYDPQEGGIFYNGVDLKTIRRTSLQELVSVVPQDPSLFHRSVIDNVRFVKPTATLEEVEEACRKAFAHDFVKTLPKGYETIVGERGVKLSVGQRQRIAIARAILKNSPFIIFDEATAALDSESEAAIQKAIGSLFADKSCIVIAHRLSTLRSMDRILVFDKGHIIEDGTPAELEQKEGGLYAKLWKLQSKGFIGDEISA